MYGDITTPRPGAAVARLDKFLNTELLAATTRADADTVWRLKINAKRRLAEVPPVSLEGTAAAILDGLRGAGTDSSRGC